MKNKKQKLKKKEQCILVDYNYVFTKDNVIYGVYLQFPDGSLLKNYDDIQDPLFPLGGKRTKYNNQIQIEINQRKNESN